MVEQAAVNRKVEGSSPSSAAKTARERFLSRVCIS